MYNMFRKCKLKISFGILDKDGSIIKGKFVAVLNKSCNMPLGHITGVE
jgi:hypothetical protein